MIENIGAYSQVDYDRGYRQAQTDTTTDCSDCEARIRAEVIDEFYTMCREKYWFSSDFMNFFDEVREKLKEQTE